MSLVTKVTVVKGPNLVMKDDKAINRMEKVIIGKFVVLYYTSFDDLVGRIFQNNNTVIS